MVVKKALLCSALLVAACVQAFAPAASGLPSVTASRVSAAVPRDSANSNTSVAMEDISSRGDAEQKFQAVVGKLQQNSPTQTNLTCIYL
jgi:hypothetical protein